MGRVTIATSMLLELLCRLGISTNILRAAPVSGSLPSSPASWLQPSSSRRSPPVLRELPLPSHHGRAQAVEALPAVEHAGPPRPCSVPIEYAERLLHKHAGVGVQRETLHAGTGVAVPEPGADGGPVPGSMTRSRSQAAVVVKLVLEGSGGGNSAGGALAPHHG
jgi:hypothetical protein